MIFEWRTVSRKYGLDGYFLDFGWITARVIHYQDLIKASNQGFKLSIGDKKCVKLFPTKDAAIEAAEEVLLEQCASILKKAAKIKLDKAAGEV